VAGLTRALLIALALLVTPAQAQEEIDPWEGYNRWMFDSMAIPTA
jgi:ABC-type transporter lipoprotein component MlaA